ncbi:MAG: T9SS type A sorting domain-containing protein [Bacteroidales bacterium]|nr:T9SS type A sorting domain-containing protein [Bacteroidales bacterium]
MCILFSCGSFYSGYTQYNDVTISSPSFEDVLGNPSFEGWQYNGSDLFITDVPDNGGQWSFKCFAAPANEYSIPLNAAYQTITGVPNGSRVFIRGCIKVAEFNQNLEGAPSIGLAKIQKNGDWKILCSRNVTSNRWMCVPCISDLNMSPSDTLVIFLNPGYTQATIDIPVILFDKLIVQYDPYISIEKNDISDFNVYPNPVNEHDYLITSFENSSNCDIKLISTQGISTLLRENLSPGKHIETIDLKNYSAGIYILALISKKGIQHKKIIIR